MQGSNTRSIIEDVDYFTNMVLNPALPMQKVLEMQDTLLLLTSCQPPFFIEVGSCVLSVCLLDDFLSSFSSSFVSSDLIRRFVCLFDCV